MNAFLRRRFKLSPAFSDRPCCGLNETIRGSHVAILGLQLVVDGKVEPLRRGKPCRRKCHWLWVVSPGPISCSAYFSCGDETPSLCFWTQSASGSRYHAFCLSQTVGTLPHCQPKSALSFLTCFLPKVFHHNTKLINIRKEIIYFKGNSHYD